MQASLTTGVMSYGEGGRGEATAALVRLFEAAHQSRPTRSINAGCYLEITDRLQQRLKPNSRSAKLICRRPRHGSTQPAESRQPGNRSVAHRAADDIGRLFGVTANYLLKLPPSAMKKMFATLR